MQGGLMCDAWMFDETRMSTPRFGTAAHQRQTARRRREGGGYSSTPRKTGRPVPQQWFGRLWGLMLYTVKWPVFVIYVTSYVGRRGGVG